VTTKAEREETLRKKRRAREAHVRRTYGVTPAGLARLEEFQGGRCWGCRRATGASRELALDHNHRTGEARMLLCSTCNRLVGHFRDNPEALIRLGLALIDPPSRSAWAPPGTRPGWVPDAELAGWLASHAATAHDQGDSGTPASDC
jgi:hypothetical protein